MRAILILALVFAGAGCSEGPVLDIPEGDRAAVVRAQATLLRKPLPPPGRYPPESLNNEVARMWTDMQPGLRAVCERTFTSGCQAALARIHLSVVRDPSVNASIDAQRHIRLNTGLVGVAGSDVEVLGVLAHEVAHGLFGHLEKQQANRNRGAVRGALVGALVTSVGGGCAPGDTSSCVQYVYNMMNAAATDGAYAYSPEMEMEADQFATYVLAEMGHDPSQTLDLVIRGVRGQHQPSLTNGASFAGFFRTHPRDDQRLASLALVVRRLEQGCGRPFARGERCVEGLIVKPFYKYSDGQGLGWKKGFPIDVQIRQWEKRGVYPRIKNRSDECLAFKHAFDQCPWWRGARSGVFKGVCPDAVSVNRGVWIRCISVGPARG